MTGDGNSREFAIIGGGIAGSALAALLARAGRDVILLEQDGFPRHKLCGEFLSAESQRLLDRVGCLEEVLALGPARMTQGRFFSASGRDAVFELNGEALGLTRWSLDDALFRHASRRGAAAHQGARVTGIEEIPGGARLGVEWKDGRRTSVDARLVVGAYGRRSPLDARLERSFLDEPADALGLKRHHRPADSEAGRRLARHLRGRVEIHLFEGGYCGFTFVEGGLVNVCLLIEKSLLRGLAAPRWDEVCEAMRARSPSLRGRLAALSPAEEGFHAVAGLAFSPKGTSRGRVLFAGDAAGMIVPLCGDGQAMALESAVMLAGLIAEGDIAALGGRWDEAWKARFAGRLRRGRLLQSSLLWAPGGEALVGLISVLPRLGSALVRATRGDGSAAVGRRAVAAAVLAGLLVSSPAAHAAMPGMHHEPTVEASGLYGPYPMTREASGTSWQPDSTPHEGLHLMRGEWMMMSHGVLDLVWDRQGGARGGEKNFAAGMAMATARRPLGPGTLGLRAMVSIDPAMGPSGYPLLLQTGETADGRSGLVDRQHPHDLFMELAASYSASVGERSALFAYFGLPGEPALGPPAFMHRFSGAELPEAPISHHWLDATHISEGVSTLGASHGDWKLEGSIFTGREPDQYRWDVERPRFDSYSGRLSWNPGKDWALQASCGRIVSPEGLEPGKDQRRVTVSASVNTHAGGGLQQTTFAYGRNDDSPGRTLDAYLLESAANWAAKHTLFGRAERVEKDELFEHGGPLGNRAFSVGKLSLGYRYDLAKWRRSRWGAGLLGSVYALPAALRPAYGRMPVSLMLFLRAKLG